MTLTTHNPSHHRYLHPRYDGRPCVACHEPVGRGITLEHVEFHQAPICENCGQRLGLLAKADFYVTTNTDVNVSAQESPNA